MTDTQKAAETKKYVGGCHCGAVRFEVALDLSQPLSRCNCSICAKVAQTGTNVKPAAFRLTSGSSSLSTYRWGDVGARYFCKVCGIHVYGDGHLEYLGGDFVSVNCNTLDDVDPNHDTKVIYFDGRHDNWMAGPRETPWPIHSR
ncbi:GFA family protein [Sandaracinus amylolyticus]|uniref:Gfa-like protein n=1 Tax=Sandaracinus amylolyticus TaxID=927083 RepID=A0A0F6W0W9_9BACT|nr:GFA family protein [Sandaracinus amylolyticus]AKF04605.1 Gfa-like protein [Sandaracinus amylolyticus]